MGTHEPGRYASHEYPKVPQDMVDDRIPSEELPNEEAQAGVTQAEAITLTWTKSSMFATYAL